MGRLYFAFGLGVSSAMVMVACGASSETPDALTEATGEIASALPDDSDTHNGMPASVLQPLPFKKNAKLRERLSSGALGDIQAFGDADPEIAAALKTPETQTLMAYVVSCALPAGDGIVYDPHDGTPPLAWRGKHGVCSGWKGNATAACREVVSSCVLARTNALGKRVPISMRGDGVTYNVALRDKVRVDTQYRKIDPSNPDIENNGKPIPSFEACKEPYSDDGSKRGCGWHPLHVGRCIAGTKVTMSTPASHCASGAPVMLRACAGIYGCQSNEPIDPDAPYHAWLQDGDATCANKNGATVSFVCPGNGPTVSGIKTGYFSLMMASQFAKENGVPELDPSSLVDNVEGSAPVAPFHYPATEREIFTYEEAAFYGDLFSSKNSREQSRTAVLYGAMHACFSEVSNTAENQLADRLCGDPNASFQCFPNKPKPCYPPPPTGRCDTRTAGNGPSYDTCHEASGIWRQPLTVYLNDPCDLSHVSAGCLFARKPNGVR
ncbi:hypothetical protein [Pendulispora albinea]|uniref:Lipoprotein n=1 Tax=Pendulispora albinea TaxID=2741071 RepID=A0ABZ2LKE6_9BACT